MRIRMGTRVLAAVLWAGLLTACGLSAGQAKPNPHPTTTSGPVEIIGFWAKGSHVSLSPLSHNSHAITLFAPYWYSVQPNGAITSLVNTGIENQVRRLKIPIVPLFNSPSGQNFLGSLFARVNVARHIAALVRANHYQGVDIDFEPPHTRYRAGLAAFMIDLHDFLPPHSRIYLDVVPSSGGAYDFAHITAEVNAYVLMSYDEHASGTVPGPVAATPWVESKVKRILASIPANKLDLGVAFYGYDWRAGTTHAVTLPLNSLPVQAVKAAKYDAVSQEMTSTYVDSLGIKHEDWWETPKGLMAKVHFAQTLHLHGLAVWRLGYQTGSLLHLLSTAITSPGKKTAP